MWRWARAAVCAYAVVVVAEMLVFLVDSGHISASFRQFVHQVQQAQQNGSPPPQFDTTGLFGVIGAADAIQALLLPVAIVFLIWQHQAAEVARDLGYPARRSPALGVGSWFIPIVSIWFPYQALTDCLPPTHPLRPTCLTAWLAYLATGFLTALTAVISFFSPLGALIPLAFTLATLSTTVVLGWRLITAVNEDHRRALDLAAQSGAGRWGSL